MLAWIIHILTPNLAPTHPHTERENTHGITSTPTTVIQARDCVASQRDRHPDIPTSLGLFSCFARRSGNPLFFRPDPHPLCHLHFSSLAPVSCQRQYGSSGENEQAALTIHLPDCYLDRDSQGPATEAIATATATATATSTSTCACTCICSLSASPPRLASPRLNETRTADCRLPWLSEQHQPRLPASATVRACSGFWILDSTPHSADRLGSLLFGHTPPSTATDSVDSTPRVAKKNCPPAPASTTHSPTVLRRRVNTRRT